MNPRAAIPGATHDEPSQGRRGDDGRRRRDTSRPNFRTRTAISDRPVGERAAVARGAGERRERGNAAVDPAAADRPASDREIEVMYDLAVRCQRIGRLDAALHAADGLTAIAPDSHRGFALRGAILERMGERALARACFEKALRRAPLDLEIVFALGRLCVLLGDEARGLRELRRALLLAEVRNDTAFMARAQAALDSFSARMPLPRG